MDAKVMKCGHSANAVDGEGNPCCAICAGIDPRAYEVDDTYIQDPKRKARCTYYGKNVGNTKYGYNECSECAEQEDNKCHCEKLSSPDLAFFTSHPDKEFDEFYCGCHSWN